MQDGGRHLTRGGAAGPCIGGAPGSSLSTLNFGNHNFHFLCVTLILFIYTVSSPVSLRAVTVSKDFLGL